MHRPSYAIYLWSLYTSVSVMHTLACVYAAEGKTTEARQLLLAAMAAGNKSEPNQEVWFGLGLTYEQFGAKEAAIEAYKRVKARRDT